jgi:NAD(P)-dependent dehydrogenase (short-subunit alcohol dehydrogenase family)
MARNDAETAAMLDDPKTKHPQPPQPAQQQSPPGHESEMDPKPDHGETSYKGSGKLTGRAAIITGADSGIGRAVAIAFAREGADVLISYLNETDDAEETARWVRDAGRRAVVMPGDISNPAHCREIVQQAVEEFGRLDILVNNAAYQMSYESLDEIPDDEFERTFRTNLFPQFWLAKAAVPHMKPGSAIVNTCSINAKNPLPQLLAYAASKGAIVNFTAGLAQLIAEKGIRVNSVAPGPIWTPLIPSTMPAEKVKSFGKETPLGRAGQPAELAGAYVFLVSDEASYVTGAVVPVTGGRPML